MKNNNFKYQKNVYLFELDSVRNSPEEVSIGLRALYEEILKNGNTVILSFNQVIDSKTFFQAIYNEKNYIHIKNLFANGLIKISRYNKTRTLAQFALNSLSKNSADKFFDVFVFSILPDKLQNGEVYETLGEAIRFSDPNLLDEKVKEYVEKYPDINNIEKIFSILKRWVEMVLFLSQQEYAYNSVKKQKNKFALDRIIGKVIFLSEKGLTFGFEELIDANTLKIIIKSVYSEIKRDINNRNGLDCEKKKNEYIRAKKKRSVLYKCLDKLIDIYGLEKISIVKLVVDLCYNYSVEYSIDNIFLHYDEKNYQSFVNDFRSRFISYYQMHYQKVNEYIVSDLSFLNNTGFTIKDNIRSYKIPHFTYPDYLAGVRTQSVENSKKKKYQDDYKKQSVFWGLNIIKRKLQYSIFLLLFFIILLLLQMFFNIFETWLLDSMSRLAANPIYAFLYSDTIKSLIIITISGFLSWIITKTFTLCYYKYNKSEHRWEIPDFVDCFICFFKSIIYFFVYLLTCRKVIKKW